MKKLSELELNASVIIKCPSFGKDDNWVSSGDLRVWAINHIKELIDDNYDLIAAYLISMFEITLEDLK